MDDRRFQGFSKQLTILDLSIKCKLNAWKNNGRPLFMVISVRILVGKKRLSSVLHFLRKVCADTDNVPVIGVSL